MATYFIENKAGVFKVFTRGSLRMRAAELGTLTLFDNAALKVLQKSGKYINAYSFGTQVMIQGLAYRSPREICTLAAETYEEFKQTNFECERLTSGIAKNHIKCLIWLQEHGFTIHPAGDCEKIFGDD